MPINSQIYQFALHHLLNLPHCRWLGIGLDQNTNPPTWTAPWRDDLVDNSEHHNLHGGVIATLIDMASASAIAAKLNDFETLVTLDMRIDYLSRPEPHQDVRVQADCFDCNSQIAFVRSQCYQQDASQPFALGTATFIHTPLSDSERQTLQHFLQQESSLHG